MEIVALGQNKETAEKEVSLLTSKLLKAEVEKEELKAKLETLKSEEEEDQAKWQRANLDFDRIKFLYEKGNKENTKLAESYKKEIKELISQKLESDNRYADLVTEREKSREKERIMLNTFDFWKTNFEIFNTKGEEASKKPNRPVIEENVYDCDQCVYQATTQGDLKDHKKDNHNSDFKCDECGHTVLTEGDLRGHKEAYHTVQQDKNADMVYLCNDCDMEYTTVSDLKDHTENVHTVRADATCEKCDYVGKSMVDLEHHRISKHYHFQYFCGGCNFETLNKEVLKTHTANKHGSSIIKTTREKVTPQPKCNPRDSHHSTECCDRDPRTNKPLIYSHQQRKSNGVCIDWNKGQCDKEELCKLSHVEIEECRYANYCSRSNCKFWHDVEGKYPFLEETRFARRNQ